jgi:hypothetical protein
VMVLMEAASDGGGWCSLGCLLPAHRLRCLGVDALGSAMAQAARARPWMAVSVDGATLDGVGLDGDGRYRLGRHWPGRCIGYFFVCLRPGWAITTYN